MNTDVFLPNELATVEYGAKLGSVMSEGGVIYLSGSLGAGKTTFSRGVLTAFGHSGPVKSPTYTLVEPYEMGQMMIYHFDLYRLGDPEELEFLGIRDYFLRPHLSLIEWPQKGRGFIPEPDIQASLNPAREGRKLNLKSKTARGVEILSLL